jgi:RNA recognition motif-containing protein
MSFTVFLGNLPLWVTADDIKTWLQADNLVADSIKVIRNPETQESKGFAFIEAPNAEEMQSVIRRFDRAPLEDKMLRANPAQPPKGKGAVAPVGFMPPRSAAPGGGGAVGLAVGGPPRVDGVDRKSRGGKKHKKRTSNQPQSAFAEELAKAL